MRSQNGFTLIESTVMLVIVGLALGVAVKSQELIAGAQVRRLISQLDDIKAGYFGFCDRFRALPGDYGKASTTIDGIATDGDNNGQIQSIADGSAKDEYIAAWEHLSYAGFINARYAYAAVPETSLSAPTNPYGRFMRIIYDGVYGAAASPSRHNLKTGNGIPSDFMAEIDRKIDDGSPIGGTFRFSTYDGGGTLGVAPAATNCISGTTWITVPVESNCGGASLL